MIKTEKKRVAIIGAGSSGIAAARQALDYDVEPVVFESSDDFGGLWRFKPTETDEASVMRTTVINTSKEMTAYSDYPPPPEFANYMHNEKLLQYFKNYVNNFNLEQYIRYKHCVDNVYRAPDYETTGKWKVSYKNDKNEEITEEYDGVLLCTGHHKTPSTPEWPNQNKFKGRITHAHSYKDYNGYENKVVAVVGLGNSGVDIAVELSRLAKQVYLISRRGAWIMYRNSYYGVPFDMTLNTRVFATIFNNFPMWLIEKLAKQDVEKRFEHKKYGLRPAHGLFSAHITLNDELQNRLCCGTIVVKPGIRSFTETGVVFDDNTKIDHIDDVICSTGYAFDFSMVEKGDLIPVENNKVSTLYKYMYPLSTSDHNSLAIIGLIQPIGSIMPISEMQARVFFDVLTGGSKLPNESRMKIDIEEKQKSLEQRYVKSPRHTIQVDYVQFMDELAELIGCVPSVLDYALKDPALAWKLYFGPNAPYVYRLEGPKPWPGARNAIMTLSDRVECGMSNTTKKVCRNLKHDFRCCQKLFNGYFSETTIMFGAAGFLILVFSIIFRRLFY